jgi:conjugal transfer/entry exclusion protein
MGAIDMTMDEIETMLAPDGKLDAAEVQEHADIIAIMRARRQQMRGNAPRYMPRDSNVFSKIRRSSQGDQLSM